MHLKITSPEGSLYNGDIKKLRVATEAGEITILNQHQPLTTIVKPSLMYVTPSEGTPDEKFIIEDDQIVLSVGKGLLLGDGNSLVLTTSGGTHSPAESEEVLQKMKRDMEDQLEKIRVDGNMEDIEKAYANIEKVTADLRLRKIGGIHSSK